MNIGELKAKRARLVTEAQAILETASKEVRSLSADENAKIEAMEKEADGLTSTIDRAEKMDARSKALAAPATRALGAEDIELSARDKAQYSILRAIRTKAEGRPLDGLEKEVSDEIAKRTGKAPQGFYVPARALSVETRALNLTTGTGAVITQPMGFIDLLRSRTFLDKVGATFMTDLHGKFAIPRLSGGATAYWISSDGGNLTASNQTADQVTLTPKIVGAYTDITRSFIAQTSVDAETLVRGDLAKVIARAIDTAALSGSGASGEPTGLVNNASVPSINIDGGTPTWAEVVHLETLLSNSNADEGSMAYVTNSKVVGKLKTTFKTPTYNSNGYLMDSDGTMNGYKVVKSNTVISNTTDSYGANLSRLFFGNWSDLLVALFGSLDLLVDPYTGSASGTVRIVGLQDVDINVRHPESFAYAREIDANVVIV